MDLGVIFWKAVIIGVLILIYNIWARKKDVVIEELRKLFKKK